MPAKLETPLTRGILGKLRRKGGLWQKIHGSPYQRKGLPDIIGCYQGLFVGLEVKRPGVKATDLQLYTLDKIRAAGGIAAVIMSFEEAEAILDRATEPDGTARSSVPMPPTSALPGRRRTTQ